jgi:hypothetical protein
MQDHLARFTGDWAVFCLRSRGFTIAELDYFDRSGLGETTGWVLGKTICGGRECPSRGPPPPSIAAGERGCGWPHPTRLSRPCRPTPAKGRASPLDAAALSNAPVGWA